MRKIISQTFVFVGIWLIPIVLWSQATVSEVTESILTYPYDDPNPIPILKDNPKIYPYHKFDGYSQTGKMQDWKIIRLENEFISVDVLPDAGGKVYGAIEKATGEEFIYKNKVLKFRNIAMRGPWTSGGIEFNFGIIGHAPSTASSVDYTMRKNQDGSVSCIVGNMDLPSRTHWRVEIRLPKDKAYFETNVIWYNPTLVTQSYYNWMTAAASASEDLEFFCPGDTYLKHSGEPKSWPKDEGGRTLSNYKENNFGPSKSYHVVGEYDNFFGGYFHEKEFGFGHKALYDEMPGQKLWLWALSRSGGIWEDLLTDTDGQYIEFQAGRLFDQYSPGGHDNSITQVGFEPNAADTWSEKWFPVKQIGGISAVSDEAVLHVEKIDGQWKLGVNALGAINSPIIVSSRGKQIWKGTVNLQPMEVFEQTLPATLSEPFEVQIPKAGIDYDSDPAKKALKRPFYASTPTKKETPSYLYFQGVQQMNFREYDKAVESFNNCLRKDPYYIEALVKLADVYLERGSIELADETVGFALRIDTYHPGANFLAGAIYQAKENDVNALEAFGWAARSMQYRSAAYAQMSQISFRMGKYDLAKNYANKALDYDPNQLSALWTLSVIAREERDRRSAEASIDAMLAIDPLHHLAYAERFLLLQDEASEKKLKASIHNEFSHETYLEMAIAYHKLDQSNSAIKLLETGPKHPKNQLWQAWLLRDSKTLSNRILTEAIDASPTFVFPYRPESHKVMFWAQDMSSSWKAKYYLGLSEWARRDETSALSSLKACKMEPDFAPFYVMRAQLDDKTRMRDLNKALELDEGNWRYHHLLVEENMRIGRIPVALGFAKSGAQKFPDNNALGLDLAKVLLANGEYQASIDQLSKLKILPFEGASESRKIYEQAYIQAAIQKMEASDYKGAVTLLTKALEWPEQLGVGKPFDPEERMTNYLLGHSYEQLKKNKNASECYRKVADQTLNSASQSSYQNYLGLWAVNQLDGREAAEKLLAAMPSEGAEMDYVKRKWEGKTTDIRTRGMSPANGNSNSAFTLFEKCLKVTGR